VVLAFFFLPPPISVATFAAAFANKPMTVNQSDKHAAWARFVGCLAHFVGSFCASHSVQTSFCFPPGS
jgi:hypothetical protein